MTSKPRATDRDPAESPGAERLVIRDKRRIDPTGTRTRAARHAATDPADAATATEHRPVGRHARSGQEGPEEEPVSAQANGNTAGGSAGTGSDASARPDPGASAKPTPKPTPKPKPTPEPAASASGAAASGATASGATGPASEPDTADAAVVDEPVVGEVVESAEAPAGREPVESTPGTAPLGAELAALRSELDERTRDLQRVTAEYANYRKRVDRDKGLSSEQATGAVLAALLPILDDLDRAREHGDLVGPFGTVAEQLSAALGKFGLTPFGEKGDPFDPTRHEAVAHLTSAEVTEPTCVDVMRRGYLLGDRLLRAALVAVADPE
ncbi:nucleotide exchange factor GrpE [Micromonospora sp. LOL_023]|uniref:nucleotide exchange factor GrpE n=1 Tax=Micromonospora sp. LOL_023 TaxID=3345418 RepID=UPI003A8426CD